jgi:protein-S-isoprenylcysteine O-methyltransferase Ste14
MLQLVLLGATLIAGSTGPAWAGGLRLATTVAGLGLIVAGLGVALRAVIDLRTALTPFPRPRIGALLVEHGAYRLVRHPIYAGLVLAAFGYALAMAAPLAILAAAGLVLLLDLKARREEAWLLGHHPGYEAYRRRTRRFLPGLY